MNGERVSLKELPLQEGEPCLNHEYQSTQDYDESYHTNLSTTISEKASDHVGRCILVLLILAIFIFGIIVAFVVGHWIAKPGANINNETKFKPTTSSSVLPSTTAVQSLVISIKNASTVSIGNRENKNIKDSHTLELNDIYPPSTLYTPNEIFHYTSKAHIKKHRKVLLNPVPQNIFPIHYSIQFDFTSFSNERIVGNASIILHSLSNTTSNNITFHCGTNIYIDRIQLRFNERSVTIHSVKRNMRSRTIVLVLKENLAAGRYQLQIDFITQICGDAVCGAYCYRSESNQKGHGSQSKVISFTTNFEPTLARTFFPCWDEPQIKATFDLSVVHPRTVTVLSNSAPQRVLSDDAEKDTILTVFQQTPPMSAYLVAFAVGPFVSLETRTSRNLPLKIWTFADNIASAKFAANFSPSMFDRLEKEFQVLYPFSKLDFVAARSFPVGGMENWGLVIYHDNMLLLNSFLEDNDNLTVDLLDLRYGIEKIVTHELTHQWFGNLVTFNNWSEIWLNEGFASFYVYDVLKDMHPYLTDIEYYLYLAQLLNKQTSDEKMSLVKHMRNEAEVERAFDRFHMYTKGCVIIEMIKNLVTKRQFRISVQRYLMTNQFKAVGREALWMSMPTYVKFGTEKEMLENVVEPWLVNSGMPEVTVSRNYRDGTVRITQRTSDQNRYIIFLNDYAAKQQFVNDIEVSETRVAMLKKLRKSRSPILPESYNQESRLPDGSIPFDDSLFDDVTSVTPLEDNHVPTHSEEIVNEMLRKKAERRGKRVRPEKEKKSAKTTKTAKKLVLKNPFGFESRTKFRRSQRKKQYWTIPFSYQLLSTNSDKDGIVKQFWLQNETLTFEDNDLKDTVAFLANPEWIYPYRVNYDLTNWKALIQLLNKNHQKIPIKSRIQLINDAEFYLKQSGIPEVYASLIKYLSKETDLGVLLHGLDAVYRFGDLVKGTKLDEKVFGFLAKVVRQIDKVFNESRANPEKAAVWLIDPERLIQLYQLRCATNLKTCEEDKQVIKWISANGVSDSDYYLQIAAVCHHLFNGATRRELQMITDGLKHFSGKWSENLQLAICVQNEEILKKAVEHIVNTKNAAIYTAALQNDHFLFYNLKFRKLFWSAIGTMPLDERKMLFSAETKDSFHVGRVLVHSVRSQTELYVLKRAMPSWGYHMQMHLQYVENKLKWISGTVVPRLEEFLQAEISA